MWRKDVKGICKPGQLQCKPKSISTILKFQNKKFCSSWICSMGLFASIMSLHRAFLHATDTSFATLILWKLVAYAVLNWSFHCPHYQLCTLNWTEMAMCSGLGCESVWSSLYQRSFLGLNKQHWHSVCYLQQSDLSRQWRCHWWFDELQLYQLSWCLITVEQSVFKIHSSAVLAQYTKSFPAVLIALNYLLNLCRAAVSQITFVCLKTAYL